jgi:hypothetical protein
MTIFLLAILAITVISMVVGIIIDYQSGLFISDVYTVCYVIATIGACLFVAALLIDMATYSTTKSDVTKFKELQTMSQEISSDTLLELAPQIAEKNMWLADVQKRNGGFYTIFIPDVVDTLTPIDIE